MIENILLPTCRKVGKLYKGNKLKYELVEGSIKDYKFTIYGVEQDWILFELDAENKIDQDNRSLRPSNLKQEGVGNIFKTADYLLYRYVGDYHFELVIIELKSTNHKKVFDQLYGSMLLCKYYIDLALHSTMEKEKLIRETKAISIDIKFLLVTTKNEDRQGGIIVENKNGLPVFKQSLKQRKELDFGLVSSATNSVRINQQLDIYR